MIRAEIEQALRTLHQAIAQAIPEDDSGNAINAQFEHLFSTFDSSEDYTFIAQELLNNLIMFYPNFTPAIPRELLWSVGGSCMHYLSEEEMEQFAAADTEESTRH
ncbi:hypothetical protein [Oceanicoccus sp. KOV_DT_Chl]|uniref:hypothetical protein n=1 Tax=Oceanicoccus sp. KOV_DT_Chl TaxID=1904639 RepID=UPI000C7CB1CB|nr:hypothetical protein [Oceanicoccus sp. KOV_DT_Chl]